MDQKRDKYIVPQGSIFILVQNHLNTRQVCVVGFEKSITADGVLSRAGSSKAQKLNVAILS